MHRSETRLEHAVYVEGKADRLNPPKIYFDTTFNQEPDFIFRRKNGKFEVVRPNGTRSRPAEVSKITETGLSIRFQEGAIGTPSAYQWYAAYERDGKVLDRAPDATWIYHNLDVHY